MTINRTSRISLRVTAEEKELIENEASNNGVTTSEYIKKRLFEDPTLQKGVTESDKLIKKNFIVTAHLFPMIKMIAEKEIGKEKISKLKGAVEADLQQKGIIE